VVVGSRAEAKTMRKRAEQEVRNVERAKVRDDRSQAKVAVVERRSDAIAARGAVDWDVSDAVILLAVIALGVLGKEIVVGSAWVDLLPQEGQAFARVGMQLAFYALLVGTLAVLCGRHGVGVVHGFGLRAPRPVSERLVSATLAVGLAVVARGLTTVWIYLGVQLGFSPPSLETPGLLEMFGLGWVGIALAALLLVVVGPLVEELAFRGVVLGALSSLGLWPAVLISAVLFAASHATVWLLVPTFVLGALAGWLAWTRASVVPAIWLHALYNASAILAVFAVPHLQG
jgi:membrane protease YdiL (CAAX protease family)